MGSKHKHQSNTILDSRSIHKIFTLYRIHFGPSSIATQRWREREHGKKRGTQFYEVRRKHSNIHIELGIYVRITIHLHTHNISPIHVHCGRKWEKIERT